MVKGLESAAKNLNLNEKKTSVLVNNLANLNSTGYKREIRFDRLLNGEDKPKSLIRALDFTQGELIQTDNPLDIAINGEAFLVIENNEGEVQITRNGKFSISEEGYIVDSLGNKLLGERGGIQFNNDFWQNNQTIKITTSGEVFLGSSFIDKLKIVNVDDTDKLLRAANNSFRLNNTIFSDAPENSSQVLQGYLENSNVNPIVEMEEMIRISKEYESAHKMIQYIDEIMGKANEIGNIK